MDSTDVLFQPATDPSDDDDDVSRETEELSLDPDEFAPYGYTIDRKTGERRPKATAGRPKRATPDVEPSPAGHSPSLDELKAAGPGNREPDRAPGRTSVRRKTRRVKKPAQPAPPFREGPIAKGMNKLYLRAGKIVRVWDEEIGVAWISTTRKEADDDVTVGEAWEEVARTNPRIRAFLMKMIAGGAIGQLIMAHAPILLAIMMKEKISKRLPFMKLATAFLSDDEDGTPSDVSTALGGLQPGDVEQMSAMMSGFMANMPGMAAMMAGMPTPSRQAGAPRTPTTEDTVNGT